MVTQGDNLKGKKDTSRKKQFKDLKSGVNQANNHANGSKDKSNKQPSGSNNEDLEDMPLQYMQVKMASEIFLE